MDAAPQALFRLQGDILYSYALALARRGNYAAAERFLADIGEEHLTADHLLLWGKIDAQQGRYARAIQRWQGALAREPGHGAARQAIARAEALLAASPSRRLQKAALVMGCAALVAALVLNAVTLGRYRQAIGDLQASNAALVQDLARRRQEGTDQREADAARAEELAEYRQLSQDLAAGSAALDRALSQLESAYRQRTAAQMAALASLLETALAREPAAGNWGIRVTAAGQSLHLAGEVPTEHTRSVVAGTARRLTSAAEVDAGGLTVTHRYKVLPGDSLWRIAEQVYGDAARAGEIARANHDRIGPADTVYPGTSLTIP